MGCQGNANRTKPKHFSDKMKFHKIDHNHKEKEDNNIISEQRCSCPLCDSPSWTIPFQALAPERDGLRRMDRMCCKVNCLGKLWFIYKLPDRIARGDITAQTTVEGYTRNYFPHHLFLTGGAERMFSFTAHMG